MKTKSKLRYAITAMGFVVPLAIIIFCYSRILAIMNSASENILRFADGRIRQESVRMRAQSWFKFLLKFQRISQFLDIWLKLTKKRNSETVLAKRIKAERRLQKATNLKGRLLGSPKLSLKLRLISKFYTLCFKTNFQEWPRGRKLQSWWQIWLFLLWFVGFRFTRGIL